MLIFLCGTLTSCVSIRTAPSPDLPPAPPSQRTLSRRPQARKAAAQPAVRHSTVHTVAPGETLWRLSKIYDVPMASIMRANNLRQGDELTMGRILKIPRATEPHQPISMFPSDKWKYIIVHHSATDAGSSLAFHKYHLKRGWDRGVGYHFVINNGEGEKKDGFIEVTPRWLKQQDGAHCKADEMNTRGIGISLVGNFNEHRPTKKQMDALLDLVTQLQKFYRIPSSHVLGHGHVQGSNTDCPGKKFPWENFKRMLH